MESMKTVTSQLISREAQRQSAMVCLPRGLASKPVLTFHGSIEDTNSEARLRTFVGWTCLSQLYTPYAICALQRRDRAEWPPGAP